MQREDVGDPSDILSTLQFCLKMLWRGVKCNSRFCAAHLFRHRRPSSQRKTSTSACGLSIDHCASWFHGCTDCCAVCVCAVLLLKEEANSSIAGCCNTVTGKYLFCVGFAKMSACPQSGYVDIQLDNKERGHLCRA